ncbi:GyrI-like domain-containing protein [Weeksellaceae bacterium KMM 9724]|uniref:GyrI-like domain-containing protein n=1 Tax=Profundicola chukchiensis TaxID=2961959 RepID=UPI00243D4AEE|nr:GyrI-like domain-containing protein [Profundicola chukchiensis]MDG4951065.1 GyrI-like domain-containing protein [Profundicola chukchiensis]
MRNLLFALLLLVVGLAVLPLFLPKSMYVEEEYILDAPVEKVYSHFNDLQKFTKFDAWVQKDSAIVLEFSSPSYGEEASFSWKSEDSDLGNGSMTITETKLNEFIYYDVSFGDREGNLTEVIFQRMEDDKTRVIWSFDSGEVGYPFQVYNILMKGSVKANLRKGLENLNAILNKPVELDYKNQDVEKGGFQIVEQDPKKLFGVIQQTSIAGEEMNMAMTETFGLVKSYLMDANNLSVEQIGNPVVLWKQFNIEADNALFYCGYIFNEEVPEIDDLEYADIPGGKFLTTFHNGSYDSLYVTYNRMRKFASVQLFELSNDTYNVYLNNPEETAEDELKTQVFIPIIE